MTSPPVMGKITIVCSFCNGPVKITILPNRWTQFYCPKCKRAIRSS
jgi:formamidopyrimidine-DNA glycosylase